MQQLPKEVLPLLAISQEGSPSPVQWIRTSQGSFLCHRHTESLDRPPRKPVKTISDANGKNTLQNSTCPWAYLSVTSSTCWMRLFVLLEVIWWLPRNWLISAVENKILKLKENGAVEVLTGLGRKGNIIGPSRGEGRHWVRVQDRMSVRSPRMVYWAAERNLWGFWPAMRWSQIQNSTIGAALKKTRSITVRARKGSRILGSVPGLGTVTCPISPALDISIGLHPRPPKRKKFWLKYNR